MRLLYFAFLILIPVFGQAQPETIVIGHAANFTDVAKSAINPYNKAVSNGLEFAIEQNSKAISKKGLLIKIQNFDYGTKEISAIKVAKDVIASPAVAVIGFYESSESLLAAPELQKSSVPLISPVASATRLFNTNSFFHPMSFSNQDMGRSLAQFANDELAAKSVLVVSAADCAYCADLGNAFESKAKVFGISITRFDVLNDDSTFEKLNEFVKGKKYDLVLVPNYELTSAKIISSLMKVGVSGPFLGGDGWGNAGGNGFFKIVMDPKFVGYTVGHWHPMLAGTKGKAFIEAWKKRFNESPSSDSVMAYESMNRLIQAILESKSYDRLSIQKSLESIKVYDGITGRLVYSKPGGSPSKPVALLKSDIKAKRFIPLKTFLPKE